MNIILASGSPYRRALLERLNFPFSWKSPDINEKPFPGEAPEQLALRLGTEKAAAIQKTEPEALIIASDQVAVAGNRIMGKPGTAERAREQLQGVSGREVRFLTSLCVASPTQQLTTVVPYTVQFRELTSQEIHRYVEAEQPLDCAGSFKWEKLGISLFASMSGTDPTALEGLPLITLSAMLREHGLQVP